MFGHPVSQVGYVLWGLAVVGWVLFPSIIFPYAFFAIIANYVLCFGGGFLILLGVIAQAAHLIVNAIYRQQEAILAAMAKQDAKTDSKP